MIPTQSGAAAGLQSYRAAVFYLKKWYCPSPHIYFNLNTNMCDDYCAKYLYENVTAAACQPCQFACYECINGPAAGCTNCNIADNRELVGTKCECKSGYYPDPSGTTVCVTCSSQLTNCATCEKTLAGTFSCLTCATNYVWTGSACILCSILNCQTYSYVSGSCTCAQCNVGYTKNNLNGCSLCSSYMGSCL